jgi:precorrin-8X/cobalt-precorrin-8 methylmutase
MLNGIEFIRPEEIERRSFEIISEILGERRFPAFQEAIVKRVIHTTADFDFADHIMISADAEERAFQSIKAGCNIVTDTKMAAAGINRKGFSRFGGEVVCYMDDVEVAQAALQRKITRSAVCMEKAVEDKNNRIFAIGNAPTALIRLVELIKEGAAKPDLVIGVPVGFVNVVESKELLKASGAPYIVAEGRKGGSNVAAAIVNAVVKML